MTFKLLRHGRAVGSRISIYVASTVFRRDEGGYEIRNRVFRSGLICISPRLARTLLVQIIQLLSLGVFLPSGYSDDTISNSSMMSRILDIWKRQLRIRIAVFYDRGGAYLAGAGQLSRRCGRITLHLMQLILQHSNHAYFFSPHISQYRNTMSN